jgi:hypothetical protein
VHTKMKLVEVTENGASNEFKRAADNASRIQ